MNLTATRKATKMNCISSYFSGNAEWCFEVDKTEHGDSWYRDGLAWQAIEKQYLIEGWTEAVANEVGARGLEIELLLQDRLDDLNDEDPSYLDSWLKAALKKDIAEIEAALKVIRKLENK